MFEVNVKKHDRGKGRRERDKLGFWVLIEK